MLGSHPWQEVAEYAAYVCQCRALRLRPWMEAPCWTDLDAPIEDPDRTCRREAQALLRKMTSLGLSKWESDPVQAVALATSRDLRQCPACAHQFVPRRRWQKFCNDECRSHFHNARVQQAKMFNVVTLDAARTAG